MDDINKLQSAANLHFNSEVKVTSGQVNSVNPEPHTSVTGPGVQMSQVNCVQYYQMPQNCMRPLMTTQPPLYSPLLTPQQHLYGMPHHSPSVGSCIGNLTEGFRSNMVSEIHANDLAYNSKEQPLPSRQIGANVGGKDAFTEMCVRRSSDHADAMYANFVYTCGDNQRQSMEQKAYDDYSRLNGYAEEMARGWDSIVGPSGMSPSRASLSYGLPNVNSQPCMSQSTHCAATGANSLSPGVNNSTASTPNCPPNSAHSNYPYSYVDCRMDGSWGKNTLGDIGTYTMDTDSQGGSKGIPIPLVTPNGSIVMTPSDISRMGYDYQLTGGQMAQFLPYFAPINYQHFSDIKVESRTPYSRLPEQGGCAISEANVTSDSQRLSAEVTPPGHEKCDPQQPQLQVLLSHSSIVSPDTLKVTPSHQAENQVSIEKIHQENSNNTAATITQTFCTLCGMTFNEQQSGESTDIGCSLETVTVISKVTAREKLTCLLSLSSSTHSQPPLASQLICSRCLHNLNEMEVMEHRLSMYRKVVVSKLEATCQRNSNNSNDWRKTQQLIPHTSQSVQTYITEPQVSESQFTRYSGAGETDQSGGAYQTTTMSSQPEVGYQCLDSTTQTLPMIALDPPTSKNGFTDLELPGPLTTSASLLQPPADIQHSNSELPHANTDQQTREQSAEDSHTIMFGDCDIDIEDCDVNFMTDPDVLKSTEDATQFENRAENSKVIESMKNTKSEPNDDISQNIVRNSNVNIGLSNSLLNPDKHSNRPSSNSNESEQEQDDATEYHKPKLLIRNFRSRKHAKLQICRQCDQVFSNRLALSRHFERRHKTLLSHLTCDTCRRKFPSQSALSRHQQFHRTYPCKRCDKIFLKRGKWKQHQEEHRAEPLTCHECGKQCVSLQALISHGKTHTGNKSQVSHVCATCTKVFTCKRNLKVHQLQHTGEKPFSCTHCQKSFRHLSNMQSHHQLCTGNFNHQCTVCHRGFPLESLLQRHLSSCHQARLDHHCPVCQIGFAMPAQLKTHERTHASHLSTFNCQVCSRVLLTPKTLTSHMATHSSQASLNCPICNKSLTRRSLPDHLRRHTDTKGYPCPECPRNFYYRPNLANHVASVHRQLRPHICTICGRGFATKGSYTLHLRTHTGEKPFHCASCGKSFVSRTNHKRHLKCHITQTSVEVE